MTLYAPTALARSANGNLTNRSPDTLIYDQANRLIGAVVGGTTTTYVYDGDGKRASNTVSGATKSFLYDITTAVPKLIDDGERRYVWRGGLAYAASTSGVLIHVHLTDPGSDRKPKVRQSSQFTLSEAQDSAAATPRS